jgi:putative endonuclease
MMKGAGKRVRRMDHPGGCVGRRTRQPLRRLRRTHAVIMQIAAVETIGWITSGCGDAAGAGGICGARATVGTFWCAVVPVVGWLNAPQPFSDAIMYYVYIVVSIRRTLYVGMTSDLPGRVYQHKTGAFPGFTSRYKVNRLVYFERADDARAAIAREKELKGWLRQRKIALIESVNPEWEDLSDRVRLPQMATRAC